MNRLALRPRDGVRMILPAHFQPVLRAEQVVGVLVVGWRTARTRVRRAVTDSADHLRR